MKHFALFIGLVSLATTLYAQDEYPASLLMYERPGANVLVVDKSECVINIYQWQKTWKRIDKIRCETGRQKGEKQRAGDLKTPTGVYFLSRAWTDKELYQQYGSAAGIYGAGAFEINYPNHLDQLLYERDGSGIWLHGTDKPTPVATRGCIATSNRDLLRLAPYVELGETPLIIEEKLAYATPDKIKKTRQEILTFLEQWRKAWETSSNEYLAFYSDEFRTNGFDHNRWVTYKKRINQKNQDRKISFSDIAIFKARGIYSVYFTQTYSSSNTNDVGRKQLYIREKDKGKRLEIISESWEKLSPRQPISSLHLAYKAASANKSL